MSTPPELRFQDPLLLGRAAAALLVLGVLYDGVWLIHHVAGMQQPSIATEVPAPFAHFWVRVATAVIFLIWLDRVYGNLPALGAVPEHPRAWATLSFFVPPLLFFRPYQIVEESARSSSRGDASPFARLVLAWWIAFLIPPGILLSGIRSQADPLLPDEKWFRMTLADVFNVAAGILASIIVLQITERQREAMSRIRREAAAEALRVRRDAKVPMAVPAPATVPAERPTRPPVTISSPFVSAAPAVARRPSSPDIAMAAGVKRPPRIPTAELHLTAIPPRAAQITLLVVAAIVVLAFAAGAIVLATRAQYGTAAMHGAFALLVAAPAWIVAKRTAGAEERTRWFAFAAAGIVVAVINVIAMAEVVIG